MKTPLDTRGSRANDGGSARLGRKQPDGTHAHRIAHSPASGGPGAGGGPGAKDRGGRSRPKKQDRRRSVRPAHAGGIIVGQKPRYDAVFVPRSRGWHSRRAGDRCMRGGYGDVWGSECRALLVKAQKTARLAIRLDGWPGTTYSSLLGNRRGGGGGENR